MSVKTLGLLLAVALLAVTMLGAAPTRGLAQYVPLERVPPVRASATTATNLCVDCHRREETARAFPVWTRDQITHWYGAVHGREGVTCEQCHGGNPRAPVKEDAHEGVLSPRNPQSPLHYTKVAQV